MAKDTLTCSLADNIHFSSENLKELKKIVHVVFVYDKEKVVTTEEEIIKNIGNSDIAITDTLVDLGLKTVKSCPNLKIIIRSGTSTEGLSPELLASKIKVCNIKTFASESAAEYIWAQIFSLTRNISTANEYCRYGGEDVFAVSGTLLSGKILGIIGTGQVGSRLISTAKTLGMKILAFTANPSRQRAQDLGIDKFSDLSNLLKKSDIVVLTVRLDPNIFNGNKFLLGEKEIKTVKPGAMVISVSDSLNCLDLKTMTNSILKSQISKVALDNEPNRIANKFGSIGKQFMILPNVLVTPNIAFNTEESVQSKNTMTVEIVKKYITGVKIKYLNKP
jgi:phosphoglycerate dehydrogenase-like enzyme